jgi:low affinity Fe/Cu permease
MTLHTIRHQFTRFGELAAHPAAFGVVALYALLWIIFEPKTFDWHGIATLATWIMTLFITRTEHRDTQAIHAKLDELLRADTGARTELRTLDDQEPEDIVAHRKDVREQD